ncbi:Twinfilin-1 [Phytophthora nicotianae]|uniref:Twinfilin-1 n=1 Tax=Phytophthora nicotianae TaxID=4792 RepID=A0A0W8CVE0_PHYNI|nr:Twinfilin-1 [Phytophthora nicotianae]
MDATIEAWRKKMPSKRALTSTINQLVQQKSVAVLYTPTEVERIKQMTDMIAQATSDYEADEDWDRILRVVDALSNVSNRAVMEIASRVLDMIQAWGEAFLPFRHEFPLFVDTYHNMRKKGIKFPDQYDESKVPVLTPEVHSGGRSSRSTSSNQTRSIDTSSYSNTSSELGGLSTLELYRVATNVLEMFEDMLFEAQKDTSSIGSHGVMEELAVEIREIVHRLEGAIPIAVAEEDENLEKYLSINDDLHAALKKYDALLTGNQKPEEETASKSKTEDIDLIDPFGLKDDLSPKGKEDNQVSSDDDPFADFVRARTGSIKGSTVTKVVESKPEVEVKAASKTPQQDEDDPFASFVQQRATKIFSSSSNQDAEKETKLAAASTPAAPAKNLIDLWDGPSSASSSTLGASLSDPFDMLDFSTKTSISTPASANPFDTHQPQQLSQPVASKSFNPFDF